MYMLVLVVEDPSRIVMRTSPDNLILRARRGAGGKGQVLFSAQNHIRAPRPHPLLAMTYRIVSYRSRHGHARPSRPLKPSDPARNAMQHRSRAIRVGSHVMRGVHRWTGFTERVKVVTVSLLHPPLASNKRNAR